MDAIFDALKQAVENLLGRASGPLHFRLILQPLMAIIFAFIAGRKDAAAGQPAFLWEFFANPTERGRLLRSAWRDVGKIFILALVLDAIYQFIVFKSFHVVETLVVGIVLAILPYILFRGPFTRLLRRGGDKATH